MNKLQLNEIAPYLPYKLKARFQEKNSRTCRTYVIGTIGCIFSDCSIVCHDTVNACPDKFKLILYPKTIIDESWLSEANCDFKEQIIIEEFVESKIGYWNLPYNVLEILYSRHIDVFDLINKKLAINANALFSEC